MECRRYSRHLFRPVMIAISPRLEQYAEAEAEIGGVRIFGADDMIHGHEHEAHRVGKFPGRARTECEAEIIAAVIKIPKRGLFGVTPVVEADSRLTEEAELRTGRS